MAINKNTYEYIFEEKWHHPSRRMRFLRVLNRVFIGITLILTLRYLWQEQLYGKDVFIALAGVAVGFIFVACYLSHITEDYKYCNGSCKGAIRIEINLYEKYIGFVKNSVYLPCVINALIAFACLLVIFATDEKRQIGYRLFFKFYPDDAIFYFIALFGIILSILNIIYIRPLFFRLDNELIKDIYN